MDSFQYIIPDENGFKNETFDKLLAAGFYRMQHLMFTCNETAINDTSNTIPVFWLRTLVKKCTLSNTANAILKKCSRFTVTIQKAYVDDEIESLYAAYKKHVAFSVSDSAADYLHQLIFPMPFNDLMIQVRNENTLIAAGYFDKGKNAIAGIMNIYNPAYKNFSLGKFIILQKLQYALSHNIEFYYTGYISTQSTRFDYKTFPDPKAVEVLLPLQRKWLSHQIFDKVLLAEYYEKYLAVDE